MALARLKCQTAYGFLLILYLVCTPLVSTPTSSFQPTLKTFTAAAGGGRRLHEFDLALGAAAGGRVLGEAGARLGVGRAACEEEVRNST